MALKGLKIMVGQEKKNQMTIEIATDFGIEPAGRTPFDGAYNGEAFREKHLVPALREYGIVEVVLDGTGGYGSSFLEEAFGGLVRQGYFNTEQLTAKLKIVARTKEYVRYKALAERYIAKAEFGVDS